MSIQVIYPPNLTLLESPAGNDYIIGYSPSINKLVRISISALLSGRSVPLWESETAADPGYPTDFLVEWQLRFWKSLIDENGDIPEEGDSWTEVSGDDTVVSTTPDTLIKPITKPAHGFAVKNVLTLSGSSLVKVSDPGANKMVGIVSEVIDANSFKLVLGGYVSGLSGLVAGSTYYAQTDGTISTSETDMPVLLADTTTSGYLLKGPDAQKMNLGANPSLEELADASDEYAIGLLSRLGVVFRSEFVKWNETLKQLTIKGSQAIWRAYEDVTNGNMGIKVLESASEAFKIFDDIGNFMSVGVESGKRFFRVFTNLRLYNGVSYSESEFKSVECFASVTTELKSIEVPANCQLTVDITAINVQNVDKDTIFGHAQFHFKNDAGTVTDISDDKLRYEFQYSTIKGTDGYVINTDTRIDASITDQTVSINFVNTVAKHTITQCEIKYSITTLPEAP